MFLSLFTSSRRPSISPESEPDEMDEELAASNFSTSNSSMRNRLLPRNLMEIFFDSADSKTRLPSFTSIFGLPEREKKYEKKKENNLTQKRTEKGFTDFLLFSLSFFSLVFKKFSGKSPRALVGYHN